MASAQAGSSGWFTAMIPPNGALFVVANALSTAAGRPWPRAGVVCLRIASRGTSWRIPSSTRRRVRSRIVVGKLLAWSCQISWNARKAPRPGAGFAVSSGSRGALRESAAGRQAGTAGSNAWASMRRDGGIISGRACKDLAGASGKAACFARLADLSALRVIFRVTTTVTLSWFSRAAQHRRPRCQCFDRFRQCHARLAPFSRRTVEFTTPGQLSIWCDRRRSCFCAADVKHPRGSRVQQSSPAVIISGKRCTRQVRHLDPGCARLRRRREISHAPDECWAAGQDRFVRTITARVEF